MFVPSAFLVQMIFRNVVFGDIALINTIKQLYIAFCTLELYCSFYFIYLFIFFVKHGTKIFVTRCIVYYVVYQVWLAHGSILCSPSCGLRQAPFLPHVSGP